jgi:hypothetical protein
LNLLILVMKAICYDPELITELINFQYPDHIDNFCRPDDNFIS